MFCYCTYGIYCLCKSKLITYCIAKYMELHDNQNSYKVWKYKCRADVLYVI